ncbi:MAG: ribosome recycling factor [bacterium]
MPDMILLETEERMQKSIDSYQRDLNSVRTGRANPSLLDNITIDYYGTQTPIKQVGNISVPEASQLLIKPFDPSVLKDIESALNASDLGLTPQNDGSSIRLVLPQMTTERRQELVKKVNKSQEGAKVNVRNVRRDANDDLKKLELPEDELKGHLDSVQKLTDKFVALVEKVTADKEKELLTI